MVRVQRPEDCEAGENVDVGSLLHTAGAAEHHRMPGNIPNSSCDRITSSCLPGWHMSNTLLSSAERSCGFAGACAGPSAARPESAVLASLLGCSSPSARSLLALAPANAPALEHMAGH